MPTLFDLTYEVARKLDAIVEGVATGGGTTTIVDTVERLEADDYWVRGTAWVLRDAGGAHAAPEGEASVITDFVQSSATLTLRDTLTGSVAAGDKYALGKRRYPFSLLIQKVNEALHTIGPIEVTDKVTIPSLDSSQTEYSLPLRAGMDLRQVLYATDPDAADHQYVEFFDYTIERSTTGTGDLLVLTAPYAWSGNLLKIVYMDYHPALNDVTDRLNDQVNSERVVLAAVAACLEWRRSKVGSGDPTIDAKAASTAQRMATIREEAPIAAPPVATKLLIIKRAGRRYPGDQNPI
jgi:hypothetical protein